jgi:hypothetical protein
LKAVRRTFEAVKYPEGSPKRAELNKSTLTSEYMPSYKYVICNDDGIPTVCCYRTKGEAESMLGIRP